MESTSKLIFEFIAISDHVVNSLVCGIIFTEKLVEYWLNGKKVLSFVPWSEQWYEKKNSGKWDNTPDYGKFKTGYIGFQDHGRDLWFRNVKIRKL